MSLFVLKGDRKGLPYGDWFNIFVILSNLSIINHNKRAVLAALFLLLHIFLLGIFLAHFCGRNTELLFEIPQKA